MFAWSLGLYSSCQFWVLRAETVRLSSWYSSLQPTQQLILYLLSLPDHLSFYCLLLLNSWYHYIVTSRVSIDNRMWTRQYYKPCVKLFFQWIQVIFLLNWPSLLGNRFTPSGPCCWCRRADNLDKIVREDSNLAIEASFPPARVLQVSGDDLDNLTWHEIQLILIDTFVREHNLAMITVCVMLMN